MFAVVIAGFVMGETFLKMLLPSFSCSPHTIAYSVFFLFAHAIPLVSHLGKDRGMTMGGMIFSSFGFAVVVAGFAMRFSMVAAGFAV
jgi:hypothetical protein